jgi:hypothetical protein
MHIKILDCTVGNEPLPHEYEEEEEEIFSKLPEGQKPKLSVH